MKGRGKKNMLDWDRRSKKPGMGAGGKAIHTSHDHRKGREFHQML